MKRKRMHWLLILLVLPVAAVFLLFVFGLFQPVKHSVTRSIQLRQPPETVFAAIDRVEDGPGRSVTKVESVPDRNGNPASRYAVNWGRWPMVMTQLERTPPTRLVIGMSRPDGAALGTWTYAIAAVDGGCRVSLTEDGELANPLFRALARLRGLDTHIRQTLEELARKPGGNAEAKPAR